MTRVSAIRAGCILVVTFTLLSANSSPQANGQAAKAGPSMPGIYLPPNEQHPSLALPIYRKSNHGVYVSVGTERSFIGAALTGAKALYVIDYDLLAVRFAKVNRALLAASTNRADYVKLRLTAYRYAIISLPILRFLVFRWYFRLGLWYWFLWRVRRFPLDLNFLHPDLAGGLGFLSGSVLAFAPVVFAQTMIVAGMIADEIRYAGMTLPGLKMEIVAIVGFLLLLLLAPLGFFMVQLSQTEEGKAQVRHPG